VRQQVVQAPDSVIPMFVKNVMRNELLLHQADSAGIGADSTEVTEVRQAFFNGVLATMTQLRLSPAQLADSAADRSERERIAGERVEAYLAALLNNEGEFIEVPEQLVLVLRNKYENRIVPAALDRALAEATALRTAADSAAAATQPASSVPMPQGTPQPAPQP
jgi:hypothetical protein